MTGIALDRKLLARKGGTLDLRRLPDRRAYERDLTRLTPAPVPYEQILADVKRLLSDASSRRR